jgi:hypothetical protein
VDTHRPLILVPSFGAPSVGVSILGWIRQEIAPADRSA